MRRRHFTAVPRPRLDIVNWLPMDPVPLFPTALSDDHFLQHDA